MADNVTLPGTGAVIATDEVSSKHYQRVKVTFGGDGSATDVSSSDPLPVVQTGALPAGSATIGKVDIGTPAGGAVTPGDSVSNPSGVAPAAALGMVWDAVSSTWRRAGAGSGYLQMLASASRTSTTTSPTLPSYGARGVAIHLQVTSAPGGGGNLTLLLAGFLAASASTSWDPTGMTIVSLGATSWYYILHPGIGDTVEFLDTGGVKRGRQTGIPALPPRWRVQVTHSDSEMWEYAVNAVLLP